MEGGFGKSRFAGQAGREVGAVAHKIVCEKRLYKGTEVCRYVDEPRVDLFKSVFDPSKPIPFREIEHLPVRL